MAKYKPHSYQHQRVDYSLRQKCERGREATWVPRDGQPAIVFNGVFGPVDRSSSIGGFGEDSQLVGVFTTVRSNFDEAQVFQPHGRLTIGSDVYRVINPVTVGQVSIKFALGDGKA